MKPAAGEKNMVKITIIHTSTGPTQAWKNMCTYYNSISPTQARIKLNQNSTDLPQEQKKTQHWYNTGSPQVPKSKVKSQ